MRKELATNAALCTVCRACVIACHFHHTRLFGTTKSSVHIIYDADTADLVLQIDAVGAGEVSFGDGGEITRDIGFRRAGMLAGDAFFHPVKIPGLGNHAPGCAQIAIQIFCIHIEISNRANSSS